jgi:hypothetical protein
MRGKRCGADEDSKLLGYDPPSLGEIFLTFRKILMSVSSPPSNQRRIRKRVMNWLTLKMNALQSLETKAEQETRLHTTLCGLSAVHRAALAPFSLRICAGWEVVFPCTAVSHLSSRCHVFTLCFLE